VPELSVILPTRDRPQVLARVLEGLRRDPLPVERYEVLLMEDRDTSALQAVLSRFADLPLRHHLTGGQGPAHARNMGMAHARGHVLLFLDDDVEPASPLLTGHLAFHRTHPDPADAALGQVLLHPNIPLNAFRVWVEHYGPQFAYRTFQPGQLLSGRFFYTAQVSVKRALLEGETFDPAFPFPSYEDLDLGLRLAQRRGLRLHYRPELLAYHHAPYTLNRYLLRAYRVGASRPLFVQRHPEERRWVERLPGGVHAAYWLLRILSPLVMPLARAAESLPAGWAAWVRPCFALAYRTAFFEGYRAHLA